jgi:hypothetical protein
MRAGAHTAPSLIGYLTAIRDVGQRRVAMSEFLRDASPAAAIGVLAGILARAAAGEPRARAVVEAAVIAAADARTLGYAIREALYAAAKDAGRDDIARLFLTASPPTLSERELDRRLAPERVVMPRGRTLTLGERKTLARTQRRDLIARLIHDPHPDVVAILLGNPHVVERDIVRLAAQRPAVPASLALVAEHPRWVIRHAVKRALVLNPFTPVAVAIRVATTLGRADLAEVAGDPNLAAPLRQHAAERLAQGGARPLSSA